MEPYTIRNFNEDFPDDEACFDRITALVYPDGIECRTCGEVRKHHRLTNRKALSCDYCGTHVYPLAGTIFEKSTTPLKSWLYAMYLISSTRCGISAKQLERELGVTYKTAWRMFNQIRKLMGEGLGKFSGEVDADETYIGGRRRESQGGHRGRAGKDSHKSSVVEHGLRELDQTPRPFACSITIKNEQWRRDRRVPLPGSGQGAVSEAPAQPAS